MKIRIDDLLRPMTVEIDGSEPWLMAMYADFAEDAPLIEPPRLRGKLRVTLEAAGTVHVAGSLTYSPKVPCGRCDLAIEWPLDLKVDCRWLPQALEPQARERNLSEGDLDVYVLEDDTVDLEMLVNDTVQTALPNQFLAMTDAGSCRICTRDLKDSHVFGEGGPERDSPFAVLANLKDGKQRH